MPTRKRTKPSPKAGATRRTARARRAGHFVESGGTTEARMVDVSSKPVRARSATARAQVRFPPGLLARVLAEGGPKGPLEEVARAAGLLAAKRTGELIPMCHPLGLDHVEIRFAPLDPDRLEIRCRTACLGRTGVEMEALVGAALAALTVYDMTKGLDHGIRIEALELVEKRGGRSGVWRASDAAGTLSGFPRDPGETAAPRAGGVRARRAGPSTDVSPRKPR